MRSWECELPDGRGLRISVERDGCESVWLGPRIVSRSPAGVRHEGHSVSLPPAPDGRISTLDVKLTQSQRVCVVRVDGRELVPIVASGIEAPLDEGGVLRGRVGGVLLIVLGLASSLYTKSVVDSITAHESHVWRSRKLVVLGPAMVVIGLGFLLGPSRILSRMEEQRVIGRYGGWPLVYVFTLVTIGCGVGIAVDTWIDAYLASHGYHVR